MGQCREERQELAYIRERLGARCYRVAWLRFARDLSQREISRRLRISRRTVCRDLVQIAREFGRTKRKATGGPCRRNVPLDAVAAIFPAPALN